VSTRAKILLGATLALFSKGAHSAEFDPQFTWRTVQTEHFRFHFHQGEEELIEALAAQSESIYGEITGAMDWKLRMRTDVVLVDATDSANGYASALPRNRIVLFATAPEEGSTLDTYNDWSHLLFGHELTHVVHMETNHGIVRAARFIVGRIASTNGLSPGWITEGFATYMESEISRSGRGNSAWAHMIKRTAVVDDAIPNLGDLDGYQVAPPAGNLRYLFGEDFIRHIANHTAQTAWMDYIHRYGSSVPFFLPTKKAFGRRFPQLYRAWRDDFTQRYENQLADITKLGIREGRAVSPDGVWCGAPAWSPSGTQLAWSCRSLDTGSAIWLSDPSGKDAAPIVKNRGARRIRWAPDGQGMFVSGQHVVNRYNTYNDVALMDLEGRVTPLTAGARARDPELAPDGQSLLVVTNRAQANQLQRLDPDGTLTALTNNPAPIQLGAPAYRPDGDAVALTRWEDGQRDLILVRPNGVLLATLTDDAAVDRHPAWSPDGQVVYFTSDRTGVPNIFAMDLNEGQLYQVTNSRTGATQVSVSPRGDYLAFQVYREWGWEVRVMPSDRGRWIPAGPAPAVPAGAPLPPPAEVPFKHKPKKRHLHRAKSRDKNGFRASAIDSFEQVQRRNAHGKEQPIALPAKRYNPAKYLLPLYVLPTIQLSSQRGLPPLDFMPGLILGLRTSASDPLGMLGWDAGISWRNDANFFGWNVGVTVNRWLPVFRLQAAEGAVPFNGARTVDDLPYWERRLNARFTTTWPLTPDSSLFATYDFSWRRPRYPDLNESDYVGDIPLQGSLGTLSAGWRYAWSEPSPGAFSREDGRIVSIVASTAQPWLGSRDVRGGESKPVTQYLLTADWKEYIRMPWASHHTLALRTGMGFGFGPDRYIGVYQLGGTIGESAIYVTPQGYRMVRGYPQGASTGDNYWLAGLEYRLPLWRVDHGLPALPAFLRTIQLAGYVDVGNAFTGWNDVDDALGDTLVGVGAELQVATVLAWGSNVSGRVGYATGLTGNGYRPEDGVPMGRQFYFEFGGSF